jgi:hypothetical protein
MLALNQQLAEAKTPPTRTPIERQIDATGAGVDRFVFEPYGLTEEQVQIASGENVQGTAA